MKILLQQGISYPYFYGDVIYKLRKIVGNVHFDSLFPKRIKKFVRDGYDPVILRRTACLVVDFSNVNRHTSLFDCATTRKV